MMNTLEYDEFIKDIIHAGGWNLRFSPRKTPYAALPDGFGNRETGIKLHFTPQGGKIKVTGVIEHSEKVRIRRPSVFISIHQKPEFAAVYIQTHLLPRYKEEWYAAQDRIREWFAVEEDFEKVTEEVRLAGRLHETFDPEKGVHVLVGNNVEAIVNRDKTVDLRLSVSKDLAVLLLQTAVQNRNLNQDALVPCPACCEKEPDSYCGVCKGKRFVTCTERDLYWRWEKQNLQEGKIV